MTVKYDLTPKMREWVLSRDYGTHRDSWVGRAIIAVATEGVEARDALAPTAMKNAVIERLSKHRMKWSFGGSWLREGNTPNQLHAEITQVFRYIAWEQKWIRGS